MMEEGARISREELKARWAFFELRTDRWRAAFLAFPHGLIRAGVTFAELTPDERACLVAMISRYRQNLAAELDRADSYECQAWTREQFAQTHTILRMSPSGSENAPLLTFLSAPATDNEWDPRVQANKVALETPFVQLEPVIVLQHGSKHILLEGYLRAVLFMRSREPEMRIFVWTPLASARLKAA